MSDDTPATPQRRGRPPGSKNKASAMPPAVPETVSSAAAGAPDKKHNGPTSEMQAQWLARLTELKGQAARVSGNTAALKTEMKAAGGNWKVLNLTYQLVNMDPEDATALVEGVVASAIQNEIAISWVGGQATMLDIIKANEPVAPQSTSKKQLAVARANMDGYNSGRLGAPPSDNKFPPGSEEYVAWHDGRDDGQRDREGRKPTEAARFEASKAADDSLPDDDADATEDDDVFLSSVGDDEAPAERAPLF